MKIRNSGAVVTAVLAAVIFLGYAQQLSAQGNAFGHLNLVGTTGACNNAVPGGPCTQQSTLVQLDPQTGALLRVIGPVGFTVNGLAWDGTSRTLYASTAIGDVRFHGLITIDLDTGAGTPVNESVVNFGLPTDSRLGASPVHSISVDFFGHMVGWYDEFPPPVGITDTFVQIDKKTGIATEFGGTGIDTSQNGLSFSAFNLLWNIDSPKGHPDGSLTQTAYLISPADGKPILSQPLSPPTPAALGDFNPNNNLYYGLNFQSFSADHRSFIVVVNPFAGTVTTLGETVQDLHTLAFTRGRH